VQSNTCAWSARSRAGEFLGLPGGFVGLRPGLGHAAARAFRLVLRGGLGALQFGQLLLLAGGLGLFDLAARLLRFLLDLDRLLLDLGRGFLGLLGLVHRLGDLRVLTGFRIRVEDDVLPGQRQRHQSQRVQVIVQRGARHGAGLALGQPEGEEDER